MKRSFALLLVTLLALFALTACGSNRNNAGAGSSSVTPDNGDGSSVAPDNSAGENGMLDNGAASYPDENLNGNTSANNTPAGSAAGSANSTARSGNPITRGANDIVQGTENVARDTGNAIGNAGRAVGNAVGSATGRTIRSASYDQMVTNGRVHDTDGFLYDYENAMTPGTRYF